MLIVITILSPLKLDEIGHTIASEAVVARHRLYCAGFNSLQSEVPVPTLRISLAR